MRLVFGYVQLWGSQIKRNKKGRKRGKSAQAVETTPHIDQGGGAMLVPIDNLTGRQLKRRVARLVV